MNGVTGYERDFYNNVAVIKKQMVEMNESLKAIAGAVENNHSSDSAKTRQASANKISFFVAEANEFHSMGEYHEGLSLKEAVKIFNTIDPNRMHAIPTIGAHIFLEGDRIPREVDLVRGALVITENFFDEDPDPYEMPEIKAALSEIISMTVKGKISGVVIGPDQRKLIPAPHNAIDDRLLEVVFDITQTFDYMNAQGILQPDLDSREVCTTIRYLAKTFEQIYEKEAWDRKDYITTVEEFATEKLLAEYGRN